MGLPRRDEGRAGSTGGRGGVVLAAAVVMLTACGNTTGGQAQSSPSSTAASSSPGAATADAPNPGNYPSTPRAPLGAAGTAAAGSLLDAQRMAGFVTGPWEVDPRLTNAYPAGPMVLKSASAIGQFAPTSLVAVAESHGFINGFASGRQVKTTTILRNVVLRFPDPAAAAAAAAEMHQAALAEPTNGAARSAVSIPGHPDALASNYPFTPNDVTVQWAANLTAFTPHGTYVLMQQVQSADSLDAGLTLNAKALDLQIPLIDQFTPTAPSDFAALHKDPSGQLARTLPVTDTEATVVNDATYDRRGELHFQSDPIATGRTFDDTGMDLVTVGRTTVYRAADAAGAAKIVADFADQVGAMGAAPSAPVPGVPDSRCLTMPSVGTYCVAAADRYAIEVPAAQPTAAAQMMAAQYLMLTAK